MAYKDIDIPFVISFSGGRTSAFMLRQVIDGVGIPDDCHVVFANTGKEHPSTLDFIEEIERRWNVPIKWVERDFDAPTGVRLVDPNTASRNGEPFARLIEKKKFLPNPIARFCTEELKVKAIAKYMNSVGVEDATMLVGLRYDEERRWRKVHGSERQGFSYDCPMARHKHTLDDVMKFWESQDFDLKLPNNDRAFGNCDLCFLKKRVELERVMRHDPKLADWWIEQEGKINAKFRKDIPAYGQLVQQIRIQPELFKEDDDEQTIPCTCTD